jgi:hypothetical protein
MYVLENAPDRARPPFEALETIFDEGTIRRIDARGIGEGWRRVEIGRGGVSIARWLTQRVDPAGRILATNINTPFLGRTSLWRGGSLGTAIIRADYEPLRNTILDVGLVTTREFEHDVARMANPTFAVRSSIRWAVRGRRG